LCFAADVTWTGDWASLMLIRFRVLRQQN
jgi:hypothetical protein